MGKGIAISAKTKKGIFKMILEGVKPSDIKKELKRQGVELSLPSIHNYKKELRKELEDTNSPVKIPKVLGRRPKAAPQAEASVKAVTGKLPKSKTLDGQSIQIQAARYQIFVNDVQIKFISVPDSLVFADDHVLVTYSSHQVKIKF